MNKYRKHSKAHMKPLIDPRDVLDDVLSDDRSEDIERSGVEAASVCATARKLFEILCQSELSAESRTTAVQILAVLQNKLGHR